MANLKCDVCVIGAGSAGLSVAAGSAQLGLKTILIERNMMSRISSTFCADASQRTASF